MQLWTWYWQKSQVFLSTFLVFGPETLITAMPDKPGPEESA